MNLKSGRNQVKAEPNMASISDLVFLLLIFFILLSTMIKPGIPVDPPSGEGSVMDNKSPIMVTIDKDNNYFIGYDKVTKETLVSKLKEAFSKSNGKKAFILNVDKTVDSEHTVFVLDIANQNRWKVGIATKSE
jgi:biopolymer transport protein ExbD